MWTEFDPTRLLALCAQICDSYFLHHLRLPIFPLHREVLELFLVISSTNWANRVNIVQCYWCILNHLTWFPFEVWSLNFLFKILYKSFNCRNVCVRCICSKNRAFSVCLCLFLSCSYTHRGNWVKGDGGEVRQHSVYSHPVTSRTTTHLSVWLLHMHNASTGFKAAFWSTYLTSPCSLFLFFSCAYLLQWMAGALTWTNS